MRIRKRLATLTTTTPPPLPDLHLPRSEDQITRSWAQDKIMNPKLQFADDHDNTNNDIRKIVNMISCDGKKKLIEQDVEKQLVPLKKKKKSKRGNVSGAAASTGGGGAAATPRCQATLSATITWERGKTRSGPRLRLMALSKLDPSTLCSPNFN